MEMQELQTLLNQATALNKLLTESPVVMDFLKLVKEQGSLEISMPPQQDCLLTVNEAGRVLGVNANRISDYVKGGLLKAYYTPGGSRQHRKFWLSDVKKLALPAVEVRT